MTYLDNLSAECPGCDGDGSKSAQWAKEAWARNPGRKVSGAPYYKWVYYTPEGKEIAFKTVGGPCGLCRGFKVVPGDPKGFLNLNQPPAELEDLYGARDYYWYLRSPEFREAFFLPLAEIINSLGDPCLDVGCGEAVLADYVTTRYVGFDGSVTAVERFALRRNAETWADRAGGLTAVSDDSGGGKTVTVGRFEAPSIPDWRAPSTVVFGGILEVLVKPENRVILLEHYRRRYNARHLIVYDLERLDTSLLQEQYGPPVTELHLTARMPTDVRAPEVRGDEGAFPEVKLTRKILVYKTAGAPWRNFRAPSLPGLGGG